MTPQQADALISIAYAAVLLQCLELILRVLA